MFVSPKHAIALGNDTTFGMFSKRCQHELLPALLCETQNWQHHYQSKCCQLRQVVKSQESCFRKSPQHLTKSETALAIGNSENWFRRNLRIESVQLNFCCGRMMPGQANDRHCSKQSGIEVRCSFLLSTPLRLAMTQRLACSQNVANMNFCQHYCARHRTGGITTNQSVVS